MDLNLATKLIVRLVALIVCILVTRYLLPWLDKKLRLQKNADIEFWTSTFVLAADQILGVHCGTNEEKYDLVKHTLSKMFPEMDPELQNLVIEAAVKRLRDSEQNLKAGGGESRGEDVDS